MIAQYLERLAFKHVAPRGIRHIAQVSPGRGSELVAEVYSQMECEFQLAPPVTIHSVIPELLAGVWSASRESLICGPTDRVAREIVAATVSKLNKCPYCVDVHSMMLDGAGRRDLADVVATGPNARSLDAASVERAGQAALPANVRELLLERTALWRGEQLGLSRSWVEEAIQPLNPSERATARLALLTAFASHQVDDGVIQACRSDGANDEVLVAAASWAAFCAARRIGSWLTTT